MTLLRTAAPGAATGETLCPYGLFEEDDYRRLRWHTDVIVGLIANPVLRDALESFSELLVPATCRQWPSPLELPTGGNWYADLDLLSRHPATMWTHLDLDASFEEQASQAPAVAAVAYVQSVLGLSLKQALKAARIKPRTYYSWQEHPGRSPRMASQGQLWRLHQLAEDLDDALGKIGVRSWLARNDALMTALLRGRFDEVAAAAYENHSDTHSTVEFDGATDELESKPRMPRHPIVGRKMNPDDVVGTTR